MKTSKKICGAVIILLFATCRIGDAKEIHPVSAPLGLARDLRLEVFINGETTGLVGAFRQEANGALTVQPDELRQVGLLPVASASRSDGLIDLARLPGVSFAFDEASQSLRFTAKNGARAPKTIDAGIKRREPAPDSETAFGSLLNYTLFASAGGGGFDDLYDFQGVSGLFEHRIFSPFGALSTSFIATVSPNDAYDSKRLDTTWSYSDSASMINYQAGDFITGGLNWTRPMRLGGVQARRNFGLRPDLVTFPIPNLSGSAAVPSAVDVYVDNSRRFSTQTGAGPFQIANLPTGMGAGNARIVARDALGRETVTETPFFVSSQLLAPGLTDFSIAAGFPRLSYGVDSDLYDERWAASGSLRHGLTDWLTLEGHAETAEDLVNGGAGLVFGLGPYGVGSVAAAASRSDGQTGFQIALGAELELNGFNISGRTQRTFGDYRDVASLTADLPSQPARLVRSAAPPRSLDQATLSIPSPFDSTHFNFSYTQLETVEDERARIVGLSYSRPFMFDSTLSASAFADLEDEGAFGVFVGLSFALNKEVRASSKAFASSEGAGLALEASKSETREVGSVGWRMRETQGVHPGRAAAASYRTPMARVEGGVEQFGGAVRAYGQVDGAIVMAGGETFVTNRIDDAFAVIDAGASGIEVYHENRPIGRTNASGKLLATGLRSHHANQIAIDPTHLPVDAVVGGTRRAASPSDRGGAVVKFDVDAAPQAALVTLRDEKGGLLEVGSAGEGAGGAAFVVGYDGQAYVVGLVRRNRVVVQRPNGARCAAEFGFEAQRGKQVAIPDAVCRPI